MTKLQDKLNAGIDELELRLKQGTIKDIHRIYGYCLGIYISCKHMDKGYINQRMEDFVELNISARPLKELRLL